MQQQHRCNGRPVLSQFLNLQRMCEVWCCPGASNSAQTLPPSFKCLSPPFSLSHARSLLSKRWEPTRRMSTTVPRTIFNFHEDGQQSAWKERTVFSALQANPTGTRKVQTTTMHDVVKWVQLFHQWSASKLYWLPILLLSQSFFSLCSRQIEALPLVGRQMGRGGAYSYDNKRYTHKTSGFKTSGFKTSGFKTSET